MNLLDVILNTKQDVANSFFDGTLFFPPIYNPTINHFMWVLHLEVCRFVTIFTVSLMSRVMQLTIPGDMYNHLGRKSLSA